MLNPKLFTDVQPGDVVGICAPQGAYASASMEESSRTCHLLLLAPPLAREALPTGGDVWVHRRVAEPFNLHNLQDVCVYKVGGMYREQVERVM